jgi:cytoskeletal protein RodZ
MSDQIEKPRRRILSAYVLFWIMGAIFAAAYLALLGTHPEMFAISQSGPDIEQQVAQAQRDVNRAFADIDPLKQNVGNLQSDVDKLKTAQQQADYRDQQMMDKIATIETAASRTMAQADAAAQPTAKSQHKTVAAAAPGSEEPTVVAPIKPQKTNAIETGSIAHKAEKAPAAPAVAAKPTQIGLLLGSAPSVDAVKLNWSILNDRHADAVRNLHPRYVAVGKGAERTFALLAGPVASSEQAKTLCKLMNDRGVACEVSTYRGTAF